METTTDTLLGGRVRYVQAAKGFRSGIEPVLMAAAVPAQPGQRVVEGGTGAGAALLCLANRVAIREGVGVECDPDLVAIASHNAAINGFPLRFVAHDLLKFTSEEAFDHALANPPYHALSGTPSPEPGRERAKRAAPGVIGSWSQALARLLRPGGTLTLIVPTERLVEALEGCGAAQCGGLRIFPLWPKVGHVAKLLILRGVAGRRGPAVLAPGLVLHRDDGTFTDAAQSILWHAARLE